MPRANSVRRLDASGFDDPDMGRDILLEVFTELVMAHWHRLDTDFGKALSHDVCLQRTFRFAMKLEKDVDRSGGLAVHRTPAGGRNNDIPPSAPSAQVSNGRFAWLARLS